MQRETNAILELVRSRVYSMARLDQAGDEKYDSCMEELKAVKAQILQICPDFRMDTGTMDSLITVSVHQLVVAACTIYERNHDVGVSYFHVHTHCKMGSLQGVQTYLLKEAEKYTISRGVHYMTIYVPLSRMIPHANIGFVPYPVQKLPSISDDKKFQILEVHDEAREAYETVYEDQDQDEDLSERNASQYSVVIDIIRKTLGNTVMEKIRNNDPEKIREWNRRIEEEGSESLVSGVYIMLAKKLINGPRVKVYPVVFPRGSIVTTLNDMVNRSMDLIRVKVYDLEDMAEILSEEKTLDAVCQDTIGENFIKSLSRGNRGENTVITVEVSDVVLGFCIIAFKDTGFKDTGKRERSDASLDPYVKVHLVCARKFTGIGRLLLEYAMRYSAEKGARIMRLDALPHVISWYHEMGFVVGNGPGTTPTDTPHMEKVMQSIFRVMDNLKKGVRFEDSLQGSQGSAKLETPENLEILKKIESLLVDTVFSRDRSSAEEFVKRYRGFLLLRADYLRRNDVMDEDDEWDDVVDVGLPMSKILGI